MAPIQRRMSSRKQRMFIIANRLPITIKKNSDGQYSYSQSSGGLVTGLSGLSRERFDMQWMGWPGLTIPPRERYRVEYEIEEKYGGIPIWVGEKLMEAHYNGYCNGVVWPLFHYHVNDMFFVEKLWYAYREVNEIFARAVAEHVREGDIVWIHDYHLMLMPWFLKVFLNQKNIRNVQVGFFLHTPFPSSVEFRKLPYRESILEGMLHADLIGFHTYDYARHFLSSCHRSLGLDTSPNGVQYRDKTVHVGAFPIGIKPEKELGLLQEKAVHDRIDYLRNTVYKDKTVIISVDRLDYIKGLPQKFHSIDMLLRNNPHMVGKIVLIQIAVPSRQDVKEYQDLQAHISELAGRINSKYGDVDYTPIVFRYASVSPQELVSLYAMSDICLVTSTRDGMNLVAYEYITCQKDRHGSLILSEFAGAAQSMKGCLVINPWAMGDIDSAIIKALELSPEIRERNWTRMYEHVCKFTSEFWGTTFTEELMKISGQKLQELRLRQGSSSDESNESPTLSRNPSNVESEDSDTPAGEGNANSMIPAITDLTIAQEKFMRRRST